MEVCHVYVLTGLVVCMCIYMYIHDILTAGYTRSQAKVMVIKYLKGCIL